MHLDKLTMENTLRLNKSRSTSMSVCSQRALWERPALCSITLICKVVKKKKIVSFLHRWGLFTFPKWSKTLLTLFWCVSNWVRSKGSIKTSFGSRPWCLPESARIHFVEKAETVKTVYEDSYPGTFPWLPLVKLRFSHSKLIWLQVWQLQWRNLHQYPWTHPWSKQLGLSIRLQ